jgi:SAM-dependent methyltransferase
MHAWRDAPVFPTPLKALRYVPRYAILPAQAKILDAGCGAGDGLKALREAYINAQWIGIEFSRPLAWVAKFRCPWAEVRCGDIWLDDWGAYDMVYLFQRPETMPRAVEKAKAEMNKSPFDSYHQEAKLLEDILEKVKMKDWVDKIVESEKTK